MIKTIREDKIIRLVKTDDEFVLPKIEVSEEYQKKLADIRERITKHLDAFDLNRLANVFKVSESLVDLPRKALESEIWGDNQKLKPEVRDFILKNFEDIFKKLSIDDKQVKSIYIVGSIVGKYYNDYTDIDVHAVLEGESDEIIDKIGLELGRKFKNGYIYMPNSTHPINFYVLRYTKDEELYPATIDGVYDIWKDEWIQKKQPNIEIDMSIYEVSLNWSRKIELDIGELRRDLIEYLYYNEQEQKTDKIEVEGSKVSSLKQMKWKELLYDLAAIKDTMTSLKYWRTECQKKVAEEYKELPEKIEVDYKNSDIFDGIIVWKLLDRFEYISLMGNLKYIFSLFNEDAYTKEDVLEQTRGVLKIDNLWKRETTIKEPKEKKEEPKEKESDKEEPKEKVESDKKP